MKQITTARPVVTVVNSVRTLEGGGFEVRRPFPIPALSKIDPFLLLDEMGPVNYGPGQAKGAPDHPHRGFETVTYVLAGEMEHRDSSGHSGKLGPGDVQWMTAGSGIVHSEMPSDKFIKEGGKMHGFQLWVNLPAADKMMQPRYQEIAAEQIPAATSDDGGVQVKVIAGESLGIKAAIETRIPIVYQHYTVQPGAKHSQPISGEMTTFVYLFGGQGKFGAEQVEAREGQVVVFGEGEEVLFEASGDDPLELLLLAGQPLNEPVARYGPFVMNTENQIRQALWDFQNGQMGKIPAKLE